MHSWQVFDTFEDASRMAAEYIADLINKAIQKNGICHVVLPGGNSPIACLHYLSQMDLPWEKIHWYLGDERCLPQGHEDRNDVMLNKHLWSRISSSNKYPIPAELGAEEAAKIYRKQIDQVDVFDIVFLGVGEDGHTASLFPGNEALYDSRSVVPVHDSPKPPSDRVSLGASILKKADCRVVLTGGPAKAEIIARIKSGEELPINALGDIHWFVDKAGLQ